MIALDPYELYKTFTNKVNLQINNNSHELSFNKAQSKHKLNQNINSTNT